VVTDLFSPLVSIGIPVYNGEKTLFKLLESLLKQKHENIEIIVSDNASIDNTKEIINRFQGRDTRIKYFRNDKNIGIFQNFNRVFGYASGEYFMWAACDDEFDPNFISECLKVLLLNPHAVLCTANCQALFNGEIIWKTRIEQSWENQKLISRYKNTLKNFPAVGIYSLYRSAFLKDSCLWGKFLGADLVFIQEMSLFGEFCFTDKILFSYSQRNSWNTVNQDFYNLFSIPNKPRYHIPFLIMFYQNLIRIGKTKYSFYTKSRLIFVLGKHFILEFCQKLIINVLRIIFPKKIKKRILIKFYWFFLHRKNIEVLSPTIFELRNVIPRFNI
jgi:glycosyltransferase involved in cell wall biosynthesis